MIVGHDITVCGDDHTTTGSRTLRSLNLTLAATVVTTLSATEEAAEGIGEEILKRIVVFNGLYL